MRSLHVLGVVTGLLCAAVQTPVAEATPANFKPPLPVDLAGAGESLINWRTGVPHNHSVVSDGENPWPDMLSRYQNMPGIDWAAMTDHYPSRHGGFWMDAQEYGVEYDSIRDNWQKQGFAGVPGMEVSPLYWFTEYQHVLGLFKSWYAPQKIAYDETAALIREIHDHGGFPIIAHPYDDVDGNTTLRGQILTEVLKTDLATRMPFGMEVINATMESQDKVSMTLWTLFLLQGAHALPTFGRDAHSCNGENGQLPVSDAGATVPYAKTLTMTGIVEALRAGRSYISTGAGVALWVRPVNPDPNMPHDPSDYRWMGSVVPLTLSGASRLWEVVVTVNTPVSRQLQVKVGRIGLASETDLLNQSVSGTKELVIPLTVDRDLYVRAQLVDASGTTTAVDEAYSSPIWFDVP